MNRGPSFQELILTLQKYWNEKGCVLMQPYDVEKGAGTFSPSTFLRALGPEPFNAAYPEPCRRPTDGRYGDNPIRMQHYYQFQVILKPSPKNIMDLYLDSLEAVGIKSSQHDIRFVHDDWETAALGAWGLGWEVWCDGTEITQFTYFQQVGGVDLGPITGELTYGLERICMFLQGVGSVYDIRYNNDLTYGDLFHQNEIQYSHYNFELADVPTQLELFNRYQQECSRLCEAQVPSPALDYAMKASHSFNLLDARGAISVNERQSYVLRIRALAKQVAEAWLKEREKLGYPLLKPPVAREPTPEPTHTDPKSKPLPATAPLLIEVGVEEMPAKVFKGLLESLPQIWEKVMGPYGLKQEPLQIFLSPRRIALFTPAMETRQADTSSEIKGPPAQIAKDKSGAWSVAARAFTKKNEVEPDQLTVKKFGKAEYLCAQVKKTGRKTTEILSEAIPEIFSNIPWYKTMRWMDGTVTPFVRPVQWLVALLGEQVIPAEFAYCRAGNHSRGHRFLCNKPVAVTPEGYVEELRKAHVIVDPSERRRMIREQIQTFENDTKLLWHTDDDLLDHVTYLVEYPVSILGHFKPQYLNIPQEVLVSEMKEHQKYFALKDAQGKLHNCFVAVSNMICDDEDPVRAGYENVLTSRLKDAEFFLKEDQKKSLEERAGELGTLTFEKQLGTMAEKCARIAAVSEWLGTQSGLSDASFQTVAGIASLAKADLTTSLVFEFPELQGIVGRHYALLQKLPSPVAEGIYQHYLPRNAGDKLPESLEAALVGLADRMDTIAGFFGIGKQPTGSADPFALRRAAIGSLLILITHKLNLDLKLLIKTSLEAYPEKLFPGDTTALTDQILDFFKQRIIRLFGDNQRGDILNGVPQDLITAVMAASTSWHRISDLSDRIGAMDSFRKAPGFENVAATFKRVNNILDPKVTGEADTALFEYPEEKVLYRKTQETGQRLASFIAKKKYTEALEEIGAVRQPTDALFDKVLLNDKNEDVRRNRHRLIRAVKDLVIQVADFSAIQVLD